MTSQPQATISWNTPEFLAEKLQLLYTEHIIQSYQYIFHIGEDGDKDHFHVRIVPNKRLDMMEIAGFFKEPDKYDPDGKCLGTLDFGFSKQDDWLLYAIHYPPYMKMKYSNDKGEKLPYEEEDIICSPGFPLHLSMLRAYAAMEHMSASLITKLKSGADPVDMILSGDNAAMIRTVQSVMYQYRNRKDFEKLEKDFASEAQKRFTLEQYLFSLGYLVSWDQDSQLTIEKIDV